ncbi:MAG: DNA topoisomerase VI, partial [Candidatus Bathyarchaeia archaeon]
PSDKLEDIDIKRLHELLRDPRYKGEIWQREISVFMKIQRKCELEAFSRYGLTHIVDKYLPQRLKEIEE